ncbi:MAG: sigma-54-dependent transcriptional regulator [Bacteriovoracaceae bacterium]
MRDYHFLSNTFDSDILPAIVVVEDDASFANLTKIYFQKFFKCDVFVFSSPEECLQFLGASESFRENRSFCLVTDISFEGNSFDGLLLIDWLKEKNFNFVSIVMTGFASIETAINATKKGVFHYLTKPFDLEVLKNLVVDAFRSLGTTDFSQILTHGQELPKKSIQTTSYKLEEPTEDDLFCQMIGRSKKMRDVFARIQKVASSNSTVLINGPSGTGKELIAQAIHRESARNHAPVVSINCGAIPSDLLESELFGHEKGAFTGAVSTRKGRFEIADHGTLFLDEIGDMPLLLQVKLLRVLQNRMIERVGGNEALPVDVRIIAATHRDLEASVVNGDFREDLFYRLNVIPITVPALRERKEDIPLLISYFLKKYASADGRNRVKFEDDSLEALMNYAWPGNVRELENLVERLVILKGGHSIKLTDLPSKFIDGTKSPDCYSDLLELPEEGIDLKRTLSNIEDSLINQALEKTKGNKNQASKLLQLNRTTLIEKMKKKNLAFHEGPNL